MSNLTPELNLVQGVDDDDTADYLTIGLADSLAIIDGLFNNATGHAHNGAHQGGQLQFLDLTVGEDLTVNGALQVVGGSNLSTLTTSDLATLASLDVPGTTRLRGAVTIDGAINSGGTLTVTHLSVTNNASVGGTLGVGGVLTAGSGVALPAGASLTHLRYTMQGGASVLVSGTDHVRIINHLDVDYDAVVGRNLQVNGAVNANGMIANPWFNANAGVVNLSTGSVYWPTSAVGGKPTHVLGQSGDGYFHWWPASAIGPPPLTFVTANRGDKGSVSVTLNRTGYWFASCNGGMTPNQSGVHYEGDVHMTNAPSRAWRSHDGRCIIATTWDAPQLHNAGTVITASITTNDNIGLNWPFTLYAAFCPTPDYPG